ncbi:hypothetical protein [Pseudoflavonifractor phocaeensis]|uniref:hypothetical protein n=1 Tax=Pseudoflavonifractor phocaeensis TaxID=1870988 RepID=UPI003B8A8186
MEANEMIDHYLHFYNYERIQLNAGEAPLVRRLSAHRACLLSGFTGSVQVHCAFFATSLPAKIGPFRCFAPRPRCRRRTSRPDIPYRSGISRR